MVTSYTAKETMNVSSGSGGVLCNKSSRALDHREVNEVPRPRLRMARTDNELHCPGFERGKEIGVLLT
jgi:hypothetical protein